MAVNIRMTPVTDPSAWDRAGMQADTSWIVPLAPQHIAALDRSLATVKARGLAMAKVTAQDFPLPEWQGLLAGMRAELGSGRGLVLLRGLPVERYSEPDANILIWGIGTHLGEGVTQNAAGDLMGQVFDHGLAYKGNNRAYQVNAELSMHCDNSDLVGLMCLRQAKSGGETLLSSTMSVYNRILATHPEYLPLLHSGFVYDRKGEEGPDEPPISAKLPVYATAADGTLSCRYARSYIRRAEERTGIRLSPLEAEALDFLDETARDPALMMEFHLQPGDMEFANNYLVFHARRAFQDHAGTERRRHMLRLWLQDDGLRRIEDDALRFGFTRFGNHGRTARQWLAANKG